MKSSSFNRWIGPAAGVLLVAYLFWRMPWSDALRTLGEVRPGWWILALVMGAFGVWIRSLRLHWILGTPKPLLGVWRSVALGYFAGLVLPVGGGELVKIRILMKARGLDVLRAGSAVALDRLLDLVGLALGLSLLGGLQELPGPVGTLLRGMSILLLSSGFVLAVFLFRGRAVVARLSASLARAPWLARRMERIGGVLDEAEHLRGRRTWAKLMLLQVFITAFEVLTTTIALKSLPFTVALPAWAGLQVLMFSSLGFALPLLPGGAGSLQVACVLALRPWGVSLPQSLAYSLLAQLGHVLVLVSHGGSALLVGPNARGPEKAELT